MQTYTVKLKDKKIIAKDTLALFIEKPADFNFQAGQFLYLTLINPPYTDARGNTRPFSISSAPCEPDLIITLRFGESAFKNIIKWMPQGHEILIKGPIGHMTLDEDVNKPAVFLAGGVGIAPLRSLTIEEQKNNFHRKIYLFYSNRNLEDAAYLEEFRNINNPNFIFVPTLTGYNLPPNWHGETGRINAQMIKKYEPNLQKPIFFIVGLPKMVKDTKNFLLKEGVEGKNIRVELFGGY